MKFEMKVILTTLLVFEINALLNPYGPTVSNDVTNCISNFMEINFKKPGLLIFSNSKNVSTPVSNIRAELLKRIHKSMKFSIQIARPSKEQMICDEGTMHHEQNVLHRDIYETIPTANYFVIVIDSYQDFNSLASKMVRSRSWDPRAKFMVFFFNFNADDQNVYFAEKMLTCLFKFNVINIVIAVPQTKDIRNAFIYSWKPYDPPKYCGYNNESATNRVIIEDICERGLLKYKKRVFENRIPTDMKQCMLYILALERQPFVSRISSDPNIERILISEMVKTFNFKINYEFINAFRGERNALGQWDGGLKELVKKRGNVLLGGIFPDFDVHEDFQSSSTYLADLYTWVVPKAYPSPPWEALSIIFHTTVWYSVISGFIVGVTAWRVLGQFSGDSRYNRSFDHCFVNTWIVSLGFCAYVRPKKESLRVFFIMLNLYCILFVTAYQTKLIDVLRNPTYENQVDTIEELSSSGLKFGGTEELHDIFYNSTDSFDNMIGEQWIDVNDIRTALIDVVLHRNFSVLCSRLQLAHISSEMPELIDSFGDTYYVFDLNVFTVPLEMVALRGYPFMRQFSHRLEMFKQFGINDGVRRRFATMNMRKRATMIQAMNYEQPKYKALSLQHLQGGFLALTLGMFSGTVVLFVEILVSSKFVRTKFLK